MNVEDRIEQINRLLPVLLSPVLVDHLNATIAELTNKLIGADNEQTRGAIKQLRALINLPAELQFELAGYTEGLAE